MVIYERSASIKVIRYSSVNIYALEILWTFIVLEKPSLMRKKDFSCPFFGENIFGEKFFSAKIFLLRMLQFAKKSCF